MFKSASHFVNPIP